MTKLRLDVIARNDLSAVAQRARAEATKPARPLPALLLMLGRNAMFRPGAAIFLVAAVHL
jgi:hypothetical protein